MLRAEELEASTLTFHYTHNDPKCEDVVIDLKNPALDIDLACKPVDGAEANLAARRK